MIEEEKKIAPEQNLSVKSIDLKKQEISLLQKQVGLQSKVQQKQSMQTIQALLRKEVMLKDKLMDASRDINSVEKEINEAVQMKV